jgi:hypothetical protein
MDESRRCAAHSSQTGEPCKKAAIRGGTVCASHGGQAPQVKKSARERLAELVEPALEGLHTALKSGEIPSIVKAAQIVLDRTGFHPSKAIELTGEFVGPVEVVSAERLDLLSVEEKVVLVELLERVGISCRSEGGLYGD